MDETFIFDIFDQCLESGNRVDREIFGDGTEEDWYSWEATEETVYPLLNQYDQATIKVYGDGIEDQEYAVLWKRIYR